MKAKAVFMAAVLAVAGMAIQVAAQTPEEPPAKGTELRQQFLEERAEALAQILEKRAALVRLTAKKDVDVQKVQALVKEIGELREAQRKKCDEYRATMAALRQGAVAPLPGIGAGRRGIGAGAGYGPRHAQGWAGPRQGRRGIGRGVGPGVSRPNPEAAPPARPRAGRGQKPALGPGRRQAAPWVRGEAAPGRGPGFGPPRQGRMGGPGARPWGPGPRYVDRDNDGVCDYWEGADAPPPVEPPAQADDQPAE